MKKALITGITGQDGSYLAEFLLEKGYEVHGIVRRASISNTARIDHLIEKNAITLHDGDLSDSFRLFKSKQYRTPRQALTAFSTIDPQFLGQFPIPPGLNLIGKRQSKYRLEPVSLKSNDTLPEMLFIMTALQHFNCFLPLPHPSQLRFTSSVTAHITAHFCT